MDYKSLYEIRKMDFSNFEPSAPKIELDEPLENRYEGGGTSVYFLPFVGHVIIVSQLLGLSLDELYKDILQEDEKKLVQKNTLYTVATNKLYEAAMVIEGISDREQIEQCIRWQLCLDSIDEDYEYISNCDQHIVERYYRDVRLTQRSYS